MSLETIEVGAEVVERRYGTIYEVLRVTRVSPSRLFTKGCYGNERSWHRKNGREVGSSGYSSPRIYHEEGEELQKVKDMMERRRLSESLRHKNWDFFTLDTLRKIAVALSEDENAKAEAVKEAAKT